MKSTKYAEGVWLVCLPGFIKKEDEGKYRGGGGYIENLVFKIGGISEAGRGEEGLETVYWGAFDGNGVYERAVRLATQWEIEHGEVQLIPDYEIY